MSDEYSDGPDRSDDSTSSGATLLLSTWDDGEAAMIRQLLEGYGVPTQTVSDVPHTVWPITVDGLGEVRILVPENRLAEARELLAEHRRQGLEVADGEEVQPKPAPEEDGE